LSRDDIVLIVLFLFFMGLVLGTTSYIFLHR
jgi:hypothetical protein